jgi:hypothetical protein
MRRPAPICGAILFCMAVTAQARELIRIDGRSDASFDKSFAKLVRSLRGYEARAFTLGLFGVLLPKDCLSAETIVYLTFQPVSPADAPRIRPCREHLDGMSFKDIIEAADKQGHDPGLE